MSSGRIPAGVITPGVGKLGILPAVVFKPGRIEPHIKKRLAVIRGGGFISTRLDMEKAPSSELAETQSAAPISGFAEHVRAGFSNRYGGVDRGNRRYHGRRRGIDHQQNEKACHCIHCGTNGTRGKTDGSCGCNNNRLHGNSRKQTKSFKPKPVPLSLNVFR